MSSRTEKLELARKKLRQYKKQKQSGVSIAEDDSTQKSQDFSSNSSLEVNINHNGYHNQSTRSPAQSNSPNILSVSNYEISPVSDPDTLNETKNHERVQSNETPQVSVIASLPPPRHDPNSELVPSIHFETSHELFTLKSELAEAANTITRLLEEKKQTESLLEATKVYYSEHYSKNAEAYTAQITAYQKSMEQNLCEVEKKFNLEKQYREKLEEQIEEFQKMKESLNKQNRELKLEVEKKAEIVEEIQEKLLTKNTSVHNLEIKNEELTNALELANLSLKQHKFSLMNVEQSKEKDKKMLFEKQQAQILLDKTKESLLIAQNENNALKIELKNQRHIAEKEKNSLKNEVFSLKAEIEEINSEKCSLSKQIEEANEKIANIEMKYVPRSEVAEINSKVQQNAIEREQLISEIDSKQRKIEKMTESLNKITEQFDILEAENLKFKTESVDKKALMEKCESDRVAISRALTQNAELKRMYEESETKNDSLKNEVASLQQKLTTCENKAELYDVVMQDYLSTKNKLENVSGDFDELKTLWQQKCEIEKVDICVNTESTEEQWVALEKKDVEDIGLDPIMELGDSISEVGSIEVTDTSMCMPKMDISSVVSSEREPNCISTNTASGATSRASNEEGTHDLTETSFQTLLESKELEINELRNEFDAQKAIVDDLKEKINCLENEKVTNENEHQQNVLSSNAKLKEYENTIETLKAQVVDTKQQPSSASNGLTGNSVNLLSISSSEETSLNSINDKNEESRLISSSTHQSSTLLDNYRKLQVKLQAVGKECEILRFQNNQLETINAKLAGENDTIGDYIYMYHAQREAMKNRDRTKSEYIERMKEEKEELNEKVRSLELLLTNILTSATKQMQSAGEQYVGNGEGIHGQPLTDSSVENEPEKNSVLGNSMGDELVNGSNKGIMSSSKEKHLLNNEIRVKMIEALETVKSVSLSSKEHFDSINKYHFSSCKCCTGQLQTV